MGALLHRLAVEVPIVQAGMGGGLAGAELAAAVSATGALGTIGFSAPDRLRDEIAAARRGGWPIAVNLLLPFARRAHFEAASSADAVVTFWGRPKRRTSKPWIHQCGSAGEALAARAAGADAVIAQGVEAGGHVRGELPALELLARVRAAVGREYPVLSAGGVVDAAGVRERLDAGAEAAVCGTRFLMSDESRAHPAYKARLVEARKTLLTQLFGAGWPARHRVAPNAATDRWLSGDPRGPAWLRALQGASAPALSRLPIAIQFRLAAAQSPTWPIFSPIAATVDGPASLVDAGPLYAGQCVEHISDVRPAAEIVAALTP